MTGTRPYSLDDTIVAVSSATGPGRRAIVRLSGVNTDEIVKQVFTSRVSSQQPSRHHLIEGHLTLTGFHSQLPAELYFWKAPKTYTGQDLAELHTISSPPLIEQLVTDLLSAGARPAQPGEFTMRAFLNGKKDLPQAEAVLAVIEAGTDADLKQALSQLAGGVSRPLDRLRDQLLNLLADVEAGLDFVEEDIHFVSTEEILNQLNSGIDQLTALLQQLDDRSISGRPIRIAFVGNPNAGKSSLFNAIIGRSTAIVSPTAGTTRDYLTHRMTFAGCEVEWIDTAGWAESLDSIEDQAQQFGTEQSRRADLVLWCVPADETVDTKDESTIRSMSDNWISIRTKNDLASCSHIQHNSISVKTNEGMAELLKTIAERVSAIARPALSPSQSRCRHHVELAIQALSRGRELCERQEPNELLALELRTALEQIGEMTGAIYTNDLLDRVFGRFCIGK